MKIQLVEFKNTFPGNISKNCSYGTMPTWAQTVECKCCKCRTSLWRGVLSLFKPSYYQQYVNKSSSPSHRPVCCEGLGPYIKTQERRRRCASSSELSHERRILKGVASEKLQLQATHRDAQTHAGRARRKYEGGWR